MYKKFFNAICFILISHFLFSMPLMYAQEANTGIVYEELDINGLRPSDYDANGWAINSAGKWVPSPSGAKYRDTREDSWVPFTVSYDAVSRNYALFFLQNVDGKGLDSKNNVSEQEVSIQLLQEKTGADDDRRISTNIVFDISPQGKAKSLRDTWFSKEEEGFLSIEDSEGYTYDYDVIISPGKTVEIKLNHVLRGDLSYNEPENADVYELISLLHRGDSYNAVIWSNEGNWACLFEFDGFLPVVRNNWSPDNTGGYDYISLEEEDFQIGRKGGMSTGKKVLTGLAAAAAVALAIYGGYKGYQYIQNNPEIGQAISRIPGQAAAAVGLGAAKAKQVHHFASNKNGTYTPQFRAIANKYKLDLNGDWNKRAFDVTVHSGRHPPSYHTAVLEGMRRASSEAGNNRERFLNLFDKYVKQPTIQNPSILKYN